MRQQDAMASESEPRALAPPGTRVVSAQGRFNVGHVQSGTLCTLRSEQPFGSVALKQHVQSGDEVTIALPDLGALSGRALLPSGATAAPPFSITVQEQSSRRTRTTMITADGGNWTLRRVLPGTLRITAWDDQGAVSQSQVELGTPRARRTAAVSRVAGSQHISVARFFTTEQKGHEQ